MTKEFPDIKIDENNAYLKANPLELILITERGGESVITVLKQFHLI